MDLAARLLARGMGSSVPFQIRDADGRTATIGNGPPRFTLDVRTAAGRRALASLDELSICEAYMGGDLDVDGDLVTALATRTALRDNRRWIKTWRWLKPLLVGRLRCNPAWIAKHYDSGNLQLMTIDSEYRIYTPGLYETGDESLEVAATKKLQFAYDWLRIGEGRRLLDVGCGWGGFLQFAASRGAHVTGITLSKDQFAHNRALLAEKGLAGDVLYQDFFSYEPAEPFDAVSAMGVMEDLSDYDAVMAKLQQLLRPGGRAYFDFSAGHVPFGTSSFITKYVWPGRFRAVFMPELFSAISHSPFEVVELWNDRHNYYLWALQVHRRWVERKDEVVKLAGEELWRMWNLLFAGVADVMSPARGECTAYRIVLERRREIG